MTKTIFISYRHDSDAHRDKILALAQRLRHDGLDARLDRYVNGSPAEGWPRWMLDQLEEADHVLVVCTEAYYHRFRGRGSAGEGKGAAWEGALISQELYDAHGRSSKFVPVVFDRAQSSFIPEPLRGQTHYNLSSETGYRSLYDFLLNRAGVEPVKLGEIKANGRPRVAPLAYDTSTTLRPAVWDIPRPTTCFIGREDLLEKLHRQLMRAEPATPGQAIVGLGGIGKTQTALKYAERFRGQYRYGFFVRAESPADIRDSYVTIAGRLNLPARGAPYQDEAVKAVRRWLEDNDAWLLIFDNADTPEDLKPFLPERHDGRFLLTSRAQQFSSLDIFQPCRMNTLPIDDAVSLLFKRAGRLKDASEEARAFAAQLADRLGRLPLALEQAGAYIANHEIRFRDYLTSYRRRRLELLGETRPAQGEPVRTTWSLNFDQVARKSAAAADFLRVLAFLAPEAVPLEILWRGGSRLGPVLAAAVAAIDVAAIDGDEAQKTKVLQPLRRFSLIEHDIEGQTVSVHRMVQEVVREVMGEAVERRWAERVIRALAELYPWPGHGAWLMCEPLEPHARTAARHIERFSLETIEAATLLNKTGLYALKRAHFEDAEVLLRRSLKIRERLFEPDNLEIARSLSHLAATLHGLGRYQEAETCSRRTLAIRERQLGPGHLDVGVTLIDLAVICRDQGRYEEAEPLFHSSRRIWERELGPDHPDLAIHFNSLANLYLAQGRHQQAENLQRRSLEIRERLREPQHLEIGESLHDLALIYRAQGRFQEAEPLYRRSLEIRREELGVDHPLVASTLSNLADLCHDQGRDEEAERLYRRALQILEVRPCHPDVAYPLFGLAIVLRDREDLNAARQFFERALKIRGKALGVHPKVTEVARACAQLLHQMGKYDEAEAIVARHPGA